MKPDSIEEKPVTDDSGEFILRENSLSVNQRSYTRTIYTRKISDEMCPLYGTVCVIFRARLVFPPINGLTVYPIFSCLSSLNFVCCFYAVYFAWKLIFLFLPYLWQLEKEEGRRREDELQKERERVLLERRQKEEENQFIKQVRGK